MPKDKDSVVISVRLYSNSNAALPSQGSSSFLNMGMSFIKRADSQASFSTLHSQYNHGVSSKCPADPTSLGEYLGEYSSKIPADQAFAKVELHFPIATGRHSTAKLLLSAGIHCGTRYSPLLVLVSNLGRSKRIGHKRRVFKLSTIDKRRFNLGQEMDRRYRKGPQSIFLCVSARARSFCLDTIQANCFSQGC